MFEVFLYEFTIALGMYSQNKIKAQVNLTTVPVYSPLFPFSMIFEVLFTLSIIDKVKYSNLDLSFISAYFNQFLTLCQLLSVFLTSGH